MNIIYEKIRCLLIYMTKFKILIDPGCPRLSENKEGDLSTKSRFVLILTNFNACFILF